MKLYSITSPADGCSPESDDFTVYRERPVVDDVYTDVREWEVEDGPLFALASRTARCCGTGHVFVALSTDKDMLEGQATVLSALHEAPLTDSEDQHGDEIQSHYVMPLEVEQAYEPYIYTPSRRVEDDVDLSLLDDLFEENY